MGKTTNRTCRLNLSLTPDEYQYLQRDAIRCGQKLLVRARYRLLSGSPASRDEIMALIKALGILAQAAWEIERQLSTFSSLTPKAIAQLEAIDRHLIELRTIALGR